VINRGQTSNTPQSSSTVRIMYLVSGLLGDRFSKTQFLHHYEKDCKYDATSTSCMSHPMSSGLIPGHPIIIRHSLPLSATARAHPTQLCCRQIQLGQIHLRYSCQMFRTLPYAFALHSVLSFLVQTLLLPCMIHVCF
jgi:hypothetical protein